MRPLATALFTLFSLTTYADPPDAATIDGWIRELADEDTGVRDRAEKNLLDNSARSLPRIRAELDREGPHDNEATQRLERIVARIERSAKWEETFMKTPLDLAKDYVKDARCETCKRDLNPWKVIPIEHEALLRRFPDVRFFALDWICCQDKPVRTRLLAVARTADVRIDVDDDWVPALAPHLAPVKTEEEARESASLLVSLLRARGYKDDEKVVVDPEMGEAFEENGSFRVNVFAPSGKGTPAWTVRFDADGRLERIILSGR
ncbi:MAG: hypothetical protein HYY18_03520 [Planctomycetes bacterium]|nr:hypothetical protein [Planctomycetota bacterium]